MFNLLVQIDGGKKGNLPVVDVVVDSHPLSSVLEMMSFTTNIRVQDVSRLKVFRCKTRIEESINNDTKRTITSDWGSEESNDD